MDLEDAAERTHVEVAGRHRERHRRDLRRGLRLDVTGVAVAEAAVHAGRPALVLLRVDGQRLSEGVIAQPLRRLDEAMVPRALLDRGHWILARACGLERVPARLEV